MTDTPTRLGLVGAGRWGRNYISTIAALQGFELACLATSNDDNRRLVPDSCDLVPDWQKLLERDDLDGVVIATPPSTHASIAGAAIEAGLALVVEKPLTLDLGEATDLVTAAREAEAIAIVDHIYLFHPAYRALKDRVAALGPVAGISARGGNRGPFRTDTPPVWDYGTHYLAMCLDLMGQDPVTSEARTIERSDTRDGVGEIAEISLTFPSDVRAAIEVGNLMADKTRRFEVWGQDWRLVFDDLAEPALVFSDGHGDTGIATPGISPLSQVIVDFGRAIEDGGPATSSLELAADVVEILTAVTGPPT